MFPSIKTCNECSDVSNPVRRVEETNDGEKS